MKLAIAGIKRSGSTVMYNIVRLMMENVGWKVTYCGHKYTPELPLSGNEVHLYKAHSYRKRIAENVKHIFISTRNEDDRIASLRRFGGRTDKMGLAVQHFSLRKWQACGQAHSIAYNEFANDKMPLARWADDILQTGANLEEVVTAFNAIELPESGQDSKSLFFHNHITKQP